MSNVEWGEFPLGELFDIQKTESFNTDSLVEGSEYDYVTRTSVNQGVSQVTGFINQENINEAGTWSLGLLQMDFFYRRRPWYAGQFVRKIIPKIEINENSAPFFTAILNKQKPFFLSVLVRDIDKTFCNTSVMLPVKEDGSIDFSFMESVIIKLQEERISQISDLLKAKGLDQFELSAAESAAIENYRNLNWQSNNIKQLFGNSTRGKRLKSADRIPGLLPFVTAGEDSEGISAYISNSVEVFDKNTITIDMFGSAKYRCYKYGADDHIAVVHTENVPMNAVIFLTAAIHKAAHTGQFDYGHNFYAKDADSLNIIIPEKDGKPDYDLMATIISAVTKIVIRGVAERFCR